MTKKKTPARRVLFVDDDPAIRQLYERFFVEPMFEFRAAVSGDEALDIECAWSPHVVLLDLLLPEIRGTQVAIVFKLHPATHKAVLIAFGGSVLEEDRAHWCASGFDDVIPKGQDPSVVVSRVQELLERRG
jgi:DNA-binding response OmpR family regulator